MKCWKMFSKKMLPAISLLAIASLNVKPADAHNLWLSMEHHNQEVNSDANIFLVLGHLYPFGEAADPAKMKNYYCVDPKGEKRTLEIKEKKTGNAVKTDLAGTYVAAAEMNPMFMSITPKGRQFQSKKEVSDCVKCTYVNKFAKTIFHAGNPGGDAYKKELGHALEIMPQQDPGQVKAGDYLDLKVLFQGKPLQRSYVYATYLGFSTKSAFAYTTQTNAEGIASVKILTPGIWYVCLDHTKDHADKQECDEDNYSAILTFEVK